METRTLEQLKNQASRGDGQACYELYQEYKNGIHVAENEKTAQSWLNKAIDLNHPEALVVQGLNLLGRGKTEDALEYLENAGANHSLAAKNILGQFYLGNIDRTPMEYINVDLGLHLLHEAAMEGNIDSQIMLGKCFYTGKWVSRNEMMAVYFLEMARKAGSKEAETLLDEVNRIVTDLN